MAVIVGVSLAFFSLALIFGCADLISARSVSSKDADGGQFVIDVEPVSQFYLPASFGGSPQLGGEYYLHLTK
jgi:hypothetical protein